MEGGEFRRDYVPDNPDYDDNSHQATISPFVLDKFEVTVGRFRKFLGVYQAFRVTNERPKSDEGQVHGRPDTGWKQNYEIPSDEAALAAYLLDTKACSNTTWTEDPEYNELKPINCIPFPLAFAFCIWDEARLPTEAEWNFAAAGGNEQRFFPWGSSAGDVQSKAYFEQVGGLPLEVGSKHAGNGRYGQSDLAGNVLEWVLDYKARELPRTCDDCVNTVESELRMMRGGSYLVVDPVLLAVPLRLWGANSYDRREGYGFRCAREVPDMEGTE